MSALDRVLSVLEHGENEAPKPAPTKGAKWRSLPPTEKQLTALENLGEETIPLTRGEASDMISAWGKAINMQRKGTMINEYRSSLIGPKN